MPDSVDSCFATRARKSRNCVIQFKQLRFVFCCGINLSHWHQLLWNRVKKKMTAA